jgi:hypothetical protein
MEGALDRATFDSALSRVYTYVAISSLAKNLGIEEDESRDGTGIKKPFTL